MNIKILGCSGGIGTDLRTTSMLVDNNILIDAGTGVGDLSMDELLAIDHIFVTHSHLDHIAYIPLLLDTVMGFRESPVTLYAIAETIAILRAHIFNWVVWPDFTQIPNQANALLRYQELSLGQTINIDGRKIRSLPAHHVVPAVAYHLEGDELSLVFTGDTTACDALWDEVNKIANLKYLIIETAFSNHEIELAKLSKHLCPSMLAEELSKLNVKSGQQSVEVFITHLKPGEDQIIMQEIAEAGIKWPIQALRQQQMFTL